MVKSDNAADRSALLRNALDALNHMQAKLQESERSKNEPIAIIGMGCRFPGGVDSPESFWKLLRNGIDAVREVPEDRWDADAYYDPDPDVLGKMYTRHGGFLNNVDLFDAKFFGISPREAKKLDPQQRLMLEVSWHALEDGGQPPDRLRGTRTGVFVGIGSSDFANIWVKKKDFTDIDPYTGSGGGLCFAAGRISYCLGLEGPSMIVDTACSSSLVAVHLACQSLRTMECSLALAGGVNLMLLPETFIYLSRLRALAPDGRCKAFDDKADGFVRGEGCGVVVLKRLSDALRNGDTIRAIIRGSSVNQDGASSGLTVPNGSAQEEVIREALKNAGVAPAQIGFVETHGTGTALGDPIELRALIAVLGPIRSAARSLMIGSVKTNFGHLEAAAGIASLIKAALAVQYGEIPPSLHFQTLNSRVDARSLPIVIPTKTLSWPDKDEERFAGVSSFGLSGTNAHVILASAPERACESPKTSRLVSILAISAKDGESLQQLAHNYIASLGQYADIPLEEICRSANTGRSHLEHRIAVVAESTIMAKRLLSSFLDGSQSPGIFKGVAPAVRPKISLIFTGQGSEYVMMGRQLYESQPCFKETMDHCDELLRDYLELPLLSVLYAGPGQGLQIDEAQYAQPALFATEYALAKLWQSWGIEPAVVAGHGFGEYAAACVGGVFGFEDGLRLIAQRGRLIQQMSQESAMAAIFADADQVRDAIRSFPDSLSIAALNGPNHVVVSGAAKALQYVTDNLNRKGVVCERLRASHALHSPQMDAIVDEFKKAAAKISYAPSTIPLISGVTGKIMPHKEVPGADYWCQHLRHTVRFEDLMQTLRRSDCRIFIEIGPHPTLVIPGTRCLSEGFGMWVASLNQSKNDLRQMLESLGAIYAAGVPVDWSAVSSCSRNMQVSLPKYPFKAIRFSIDISNNEKKQSDIAKRDLPHHRVHPLLGRRVWLAGIKDNRRWHNELELDTVGYLKDHCVQGSVLLPATAYLEMALAAAATVYGNQPLKIFKVENRKPIIFAKNAKVFIQTVLQDRSNNEIAFQVFSSKQVQLDVDAVEINWELNVTGFLGVGAVCTEEERLSHQQIEHIKSRCTQEIAGDRFYSVLNAMGNQWGPAFQGIEQIWMGEGEALSRIRVADALQNEIDRYCFHPAVADASGQVLASVMPFAMSKKNGTGAFVGGGIEALHFYASPDTHQLWAHATFANKKDMEGDILKGDVRIFNDHGKLLAETLGARLCYLEEKSKSFAHTQIDHWFHDLRWICSDAAEVVISDPETGCWLLFADNVGICESLLAKMTHQHTQSIIVESGMEDMQIDEHSYRLRPGRQESIQWLFNNLPKKHKIEKINIIYLWGLNADSIDLEMQEPIENSYDWTLDSLLWIVKELAGSKEPFDVKLWLITRGAQYLGGEALQPGLAQSVIWGFAKTLFVEHPGFAGGLIDIDPKAKQGEAARMIICETFNPDGEDQIAYRGSQRFVARLGKCKMDRENSKALSFHSDAAYLITGGLGGIGLEVARWMVAKGARHLILLSRTGLKVPEGLLNEKEKAQNTKLLAVEELKRNGTFLECPAMDIADTRQLKDYLEQRTARGAPPIRGAFHAAGVMQYQALVDQNVTGMHEILRPKVQGGWALYQLIKKQPLDFLVLFSSASSIIHSPLVGSYAAANAFLDELANRVRALGCPAQSINWGAWSQVGMIQKHSLKTDHMASIAFADFEQITPSQGISALERILEQDSAQIAVLPMDWNRWIQRYPSFLNRPLFKLMNEIGASGIAATVPQQTPMQSFLELDPVERNMRLKNFISKEVSRVLEVSAGEIDGDVPIRNLGFDSLMAIEVKNRIETTFKVNLSIIHLLEGESIGAIAELLQEKLLQEETKVISQEEKKKSPAADARQDSALNWEEGEL